MTTPGWGESPDPQDGSDAYHPYQSPQSYPPGPGGYQSPMGYPAPARTNGLAIAALVVSLVGLVSCCLPAGLIGALLGHKANAEIKRTGEQGHGMALTGIIIGWISFALFAVATVFYVILFAVEVSRTS